MSLSQPPGGVVTPEVREMIPRNDVATAKATSSVSVPGDHAEAKNARWNRLAGYIGALIAGSASGLIYAVNKELTHTVSPLQVSWLEAVIGFAILLPPYLLRFRRDPLPEGTPWNWLALFGLTAVMLFYCRTLGISLTSATTGSLVVRFEIVLVIIYSYLFLTERLSSRAWLGGVLLVGGMLAAMDVSLAQFVLKIGGIAALLLAAGGVAGNSIIIKLHLGKVRNELTSLANVGMQSVVFALLLLFGGQFGDIPRVLSDPRTLALLVLGGLLIPGMLVPYYYAMKRIPMWSCRLLGLVTPVVAILADFFWLHSTISVGQLVGLGLVTCGAALVILSGLGPVQVRRPA